jgi:hypothetical protein
MSYLLTVLTALSLVALLILLGQWAVRESNWRPFHLGLPAVLALVAFLHWVFGFPNIDSNATPRGDGAHSVYIVVVLYICMLLGMLAHHAFTRFERPKRERKKFDMGVFLAPIFASPIVFIPLLAALQSAELDLSRLDPARMMLFLVAFQNGFFWKEYFDNRSRRNEVMDHGR